MHHPENASLNPDPPRRRRRSRVLTTIGIILAVVTAVYVALLLVDLSMAETTTTQHSYDPVNVVELEADDDVTVTGAEGAIDVEAVSHSGLREPTYSTEASGGQLTITHRCGWILALSQCSGELHVTLPAQTRVIVRTGNGDIVASGLAGEVSLDTSNGTVDTTDIDGPLTADSSNGDITMTRSGSDARASTSNGDITVSDVDGNVTADTSNGRISLDSVNGNASANTSNGPVDISNVTGNVYGDSSNGDITVTGDGEPVNLTIETSNGDQRIDAPTDPDAERTVEIHSSNGDVAYLSKS